MKIGDEVLVGAKVVGIQKDNSTGTAIKIEIVKVMHADSFGPCRVAFWVDDINKSIVLVQEKRPPA